MSDLASEPGNRAGAAEAAGADIEAPPRRTALYGAIAVGVVLALLIGLLATRDASGTRLSDSPLLGQPAPPIEGTDLLDGGTYDLADDEGRFVLVNFFATWCEPCKLEHGDLIRFAAGHQVAGDARVVSVVFADEPGNVREFFEERGGDWPVVDAGDKATLDYGVTGVPESYLIGPEGVVRAKIVGGIDADKLEDLLLRAKTDGGELRR